MSYVVAGCLDDWTYYFWTVTMTIGAAAVMAYVTFRPGLAAVLADPSMFFLLVICAMPVIVFWQARAAQGEAGTRLILRVSTRHNAGLAK